MTFAFAAIFLFAAAPPPAATDLAPGTALLDAPRLSAEPMTWNAHTTRRTLGDTEYHAIVIERPGEARLEILSREPFAVTPEPEAGERYGYSAATLEIPVARKYYRAELGGVRILEAGNVVRGTIDVGLQDAVSSCLRCPDSMIDLKGEFVATPLFDPAPTPEGP